MKKKKKLIWRVCQWILLSFLLVVTAFTVICTALYVYLASTIDTDADLLQFDLARGSRVTRFFYDQDVTTQTYEAAEWKEERLSGNEQRLWVSIDKVPPHVWQAFVAIEDKRFFKHDGVDVLRTGKAVVNYFLGFEKTFGGSTITQQVVKNVSGEKEQTPMRKLREIYRSLMLERAYNKRDILELYLNIVPLGYNITGIGAAAEIYFGKSVSELNLTEAAALAALTNSPVRYDLYRCEENNRARRSLIFDAMEKELYITREERLGAEEEKITVQKRTNKGQNINSWYIEQVVSDIIDDLVEKKKMTRTGASRLVYNGGLSIQTYVEPKVQHELEKYFEEAYKFEKDIHYSMVVLSSKTGNLVGIIGKEGVKTGNRVLNYAQVKRPPGSAIKPLTVYAPALQEGIINYASVVDDVPIEFQKTANGYRPWPYNFPRSYQGLCHMKDALAYSKNTVAVKLYQKLDPEIIYRYLVSKMHVRGVIRSGTNEQGDYVTDLAAAPLALGQLTYGANLLDMTAAYGIFLDGDYKKPASYMAVYDNRGNLLLKNEKEPENVLSRENAAIMTKLLEGVTEYGTASTLTLPSYVATAGKTGTSSFDKDRWFIGYTPDYTAGILCSAEGDKSVGDTAPGHLHAWDSVMTSIYHANKSEMKYRKEFDMPYGVYRALYCVDSGECPTEACGLDTRGCRVAIGYFTEEQLPKHLCHRHVEFLYDEEGEGIVFPEDIEYFEKKNLRRISLLNIEERNFPMEIIVHDAQYVCRKTDISIPPNDFLAPYFNSSIPKGCYVGISPIKQRPMNALSQNYADILMSPWSHLGRRKYHASITT